MKQALAPLVAAALLAAAGAAAPQAPAPTPAPSPEQSREPAPPAGSRLKLRLDELDPSRPRIRFGEREGAGGQDAVDSLPSLGPSPSRSFDRSSGPASPSGSAPFPKSMD